MARYIDETDVYKLVEPRGIAKVHCSQIDELPRADVVPKSEVEDYRDCWQRIHDSYNADCLENYNKGRQEVAREIFEEIERFLYLQFRFCKEELGNGDTKYMEGRLVQNTQIQNFIGELKNKYTE